MFTVGKKPNKKFRFRCAIALSTEMKRDSNSEEQFGERSFGPEVGKLDGLKLYIQID